MFDKVFETNAGTYKVGFNKNADIIVYEQKKFLWVYDYFSKVYTYESNDEKTKRTLDEWALLAIGSYESARRKYYQL